MQNKWYGDARDIVKWGVLLKLAELYSVKHILQVMYCHQAATWADIELDGKQFKLPREVVEHFRQPTSASRISPSVIIEVFTNLLTTDRNAYHVGLIDRIRVQSTPCIVFLDPDTGLEPKKPTLDHVLDDEVKKIWKAMKSGNLLVLYQHQTNKSGQPWIEPKRHQFASAIGLDQKSVKIAKSELIARDVVFFYAKKPAR